MNTVQFERYFAVRTPKQHQADDLIRTGQSVSYAFDLPDADLSACHRLFFTGETGMFYQWKDEPDAMKMYQEIEDALDAEHAERSRFCLDLSMKKPECYTKRVLYETTWPPTLSYLSAYPGGEDCLFGICAKAEGLCLDATEASCLRFVLEIWEKREGVPANQTGRRADRRYVVDIPTGTYPLTKIEIPVKLPVETTAYVAATLEGRGYSGKVWVECPQLAFSYRGAYLNALPDFNTSGMDNLFFDWMGVNISKKEWPEFTIALNGQIIHDGELFERCHRYAEMEVAIPAGLLKPSGNRVTFTLNSRYFGTLPYAFREVAILEQPGGYPFAVVALPEVANIREDIPVLIKTAEAGMTVAFACADGALTAPVAMTFPERGLNVYPLRAHTLCNGAVFTLSAEGKTVECVIPRMIEREADDVITGTSDQVYVSQNPDEVEEYLAWYIANHVGNFLTTRPIYRWGGARTLNPDAWALQTRICNGMGIKYAHMTEGRDLPGIGANPSVEMLAGEHFLGRQFHEKDGQMFYWGTSIFGANRRRDMYYNLAQRLFLDDPDHTDDSFRPENFFSLCGRVTWNHTENVGGDMRKMGEDATAKLARMRNGTPRHTGPSILSRYFYEAGFDHFGAELMYGTMETNTPFLRGTAKAYGKHRFGAHHAMQWSSSPHDAPEKYRRYRLALYVGYMQGITDINTEEGLWHIEEYYSYFHRFTATCRAYLRHQQDFCRYVLAHTRRGQFYAPMAYIHGRYDGTVGFGHSVFGVSGLRECDAEKSWSELLKLFYPLSRPGDSIYIHDCPARPVGYYTGTPRGQVDAVPLSGSVNVLPNYRAVAFAGYNMATVEDLDRISAYLAQGGTVILAWPHLSTTTSRAEIEANRFALLDHPLTRRLTAGAAEFAPTTVEGCDVEICTNLASDAVITARTAEGLPLRAAFAVGQGRLVLINAKAYPHHAAIRALYTETVRATHDALIADELAWISCGEDIEFAVYAHENGNRDIYVLAVDWYNDPDCARAFTLRLGDDCYAMQLPFGQMMKIAVCGSRAAFANVEDAEIVFSDSDTVRVSGLGEGTVLTVADGGRLTEYPLNFVRDAAVDVALP